MTKLQKANIALLTIAQQSEQESRVTLANMLELAAKMKHYELLPAEARLWSRKFAGQPAAAIEWAFESYLADLRDGKFFPLPGDIWDLVIVWHKNQKEVKRQAEAKAERELDDQRRAAGETVSMADVLSTFREIVKTKAMPEPDHKFRKQLQKKLAEVMERRAKRA